MLLEDALLCKLWFCWNEEKAEAKARATAASTKKAAWDVVCTAVRADPKPSSAQMTKQRWCMPV